MTTTDPTTEALGRLLDAFAIEHLLFDVADRIDAGDVDGAAALFGECSIIYFVAGDQLLEVHGIDQVRGMLGGGRSYADGTPRLRNLLTNVKVEVADDGATASSRAYITVLQATDELPLQPIAAGTLRDTFRKDGTAWRFVARIGELHLVGDMSAHMDGGLSPTAGP